ncbi:MAG TPA: glycerol-3-phosphate 1-O-acyltransferase PlsY [Candidatus Eisenbacteria bacterium]|nr:glycerol-3-phosphate 1-O-acyltransferase PlsY [Candidatus Eisenbacteria bacterium]
MPLLVPSILIGFLLGSIPTGLLIGRARGVDLRTQGSKNIGATNAFRVLGPKWGGLVFALDVVKGLMVVLLVRHFGPSWGASHDAVLTAMLAAGVAAILGHVFSPWLRFKGGRGVATSLGVFLGIVPVPTALAFLLWVILLLVSKRVSVGSIGAALAYPFLVWTLAKDVPRGVVTAVTAAVALLVILRHTANIRRLLAGTEPPIIGARREGRS